MQHGKEGNKRHKLEKRETSSWHKRLAPKLNLGARVSGRAEHGNEGEYCSQTHLQIWRQEQQLQINKSNGRLILCN